jgi:Predicted membrane protein
MSLLSQIIAAVVALIHLYVVWLEMFAWETRGPKVFRGLPKEMFPMTKTMAGNQGLYNGFLAAGLIWALLIRDPAWQANVALFFLACVAVAGAYGAATVSRRILYVQTVPAVLGILSILIPG